MIKVNSLGSGSVGNCYIVSDCGVNFLIECGISYREALRRNGNSLPEISGILISHEHTDHAGHVADWARHTSCPIVCSQGTFDSPNVQIPSYRFQRIKSQNGLKLGMTEVYGFATHHDVAEPLGFVIEFPDNKRLLYVTDSYKVDYKFSGINTFMVETNYSRELMEAYYDDSVQGHIVASRLPHSHFEVHDALSFVLSSTDKSTDEIYLIHLSQHDGDPVGFKKMFMEHTGLPIYVCKPKGGMQ